MFVCSAHKDVITARWLFSLVELVADLVVNDVGEVLGGFVVALDELCGRDALDAPERVREMRGVGKTAQTGYVADGVSATLRHQVECLLHAQVHDEGGDRLASGCLHTAVELRGAQGELFGNGADGHLAAWHLVVDNGNEPLEEFFVAESEYGHTIYTVQSS